MFGIIRYNYRVRVWGGRDGRVRGLLLFFYCMDVDIEVIWGVVSS